MLSIRALLARSLQGTSWQDLNRSLCNVAVQDLYERSLGKKLLIQGLLARPAAEIATPCLYKRSLGKISVRDRLGRSLYKISPWQNLCASSLEKISLPRSLRKISLIINMSTAPQRERSDTPKVTRGFVRDLRQKWKIRKLLCCKGHQICRTPRIPCRSTSAP